MAENPYSALMRTALAIAVPIFAFILAGRVAASRNRALGAPCPGLRRGTQWTAGSAMHPSGNSSGTIP